MILLLLSTAWSATLEVGVYGGVGNDPKPVQRRAGLAVAPGLPLGDQVSLELLAQVGAQASPGLAASARPELRLYPVGSAVSVVGGYGVGFTGAEGLSHGPALGMGLDLGEQWRVQARTVWEIGGSPRGEVTLSWVRRPGDPVVEPEPEPVVVVEPEPEPEPEPEAEVLVWVPHPWCRWMTVAEASEFLSTEELEAAKAAAGASPTRVDPSNAELDVTVVALPPRGSLLVASYPGDVVTVDGNEVQAGAENVAILTSAEGPLVVQAVGGGRTQTLDVATVNQHALWVRMDEEPPMTVVGFKVNSSALSGAGKREVKSVADQAGNWHFEVQGSFSPEGNLDANRQLADSRARSTADALIASGVPADHVMVLPAPEVLPEDAPENLRSASIRPVIVVGESP